MTGDVATVLWTGLRVVARQRVRSALLATVAGVAMLLVSTAVTVLSAMHLTETEAYPNRPDLSIQMRGLSGQTDPASARSALEAHYGDGIVTSPLIYVPDVTLRAQDGAARTSWYGEGDLSQFPLANEYRLVDGAWPSSPGEVLVTLPVAQSLAIAPGSVITFWRGTGPLTVTGVGVARTSHELAAVAGVGGTWAQATAGLSQTEISAQTSTVIEQLAVTMRSPEARAQLAEDARAWARLPASESASVNGLPVAGSRYDQAAPRAFWVTNAATVAGPTLVLLVVLVAAQLASRMRQDQTLVRAVWALGLSRAGTVLLLIASTLTPALVGAVTGAAVGLVVGRLLVPTASGYMGYDPSARPLPLAEIGVVLGVLLVAYATLAAVFGRIDTSAARLRAAGTSHHAPEAPPRPVLVPALVGAVLMIVGFGVIAILRGRTWAGLAPLATALVADGLLLLLPLGVELLGRLVRPRRLRHWLALKLTRAALARTVAVAAVVAFSLAVPIGMLIVDSSQAAYRAIVGLPAVPYGQVEVDLDGASLALSDRQAIDAAAGGSGAEILALPRSYPGEFIAVSAGEDVASAGQRGTEMDIVVVADRENADIVLGWSMSDGDWARLNAGTPLELSPGAAPLTTIDVAPRLFSGKRTPYAAQGVAVSTTEGIPNNSARGQGQILVTAQIARSWGLTPVVAGIRYPDASGNQDAIMAAAAGAGIAASRVKVSAPDPFLATPPSYVIGLILAGTLVPLVLGSIIALGRRETRGTVRQLGDLGTDASLTRSALRQGTLGAVVAGIGIGLTTGLGVTATKLWGTELPLTIPVGPVLLVSAAVAGFSWLVAAIVTPGSRQPSVRRARSGS